LYNFVACKFFIGQSVLKLGLLNSFLTFRSSFATIQILFEVQIWLWQCCIVTVQGSLHQTSSPYAGREGRPKSSSHPLNNFLADCGNRYHQWSVGT